MTWKKIFRNGSHYERSSPFSSPVTWAHVKRPSVLYFHNSFLKKKYMFTKCAMFIVYYIEVQKKCKNVVKFQLATIHGPICVDLKNLNTANNMTKLHFKSSNYGIINTFLCKDIISHFYIGIVIY